MGSDIIIIDSKKIAVSSILEIGSIHQEGPISFYEITHADGSKTKITFDAYTSNIDLFINVRHQLKEAHLNFKKLLAQRTQKTTEPRICEIPGLGAFDLKKISQISEPISANIPKKEKGRAIRVTILSFIVLDNKGAANYEAVIGEKDSAKATNFRNQRTQLIEAWKKYHNQ